MNPASITPFGQVSAYRTLSPLHVWRHGSRREKFTIFGFWLLLLGVSVALGLAAVIQEWSGLPVRFGGVEVYITVYPPLIICFLLALTCGWWWGAIPAFCATLVLALYAGMPPLWAALFACADPLGFAVMSIGYQAIAARRDLRNGGSLLFYVQLCFVSSIFSSSGALVWCYVNRIDSTGMLAIWQGWWLGAFLQSILIVGPIMAVLWPHLTRWQANRPALLSVAKVERRRSVLHLLVMVSLGVLIYGFLTIQLAGDQVRQVDLRHLGELSHALNIMQQTMWVFYWVLASLFVFTAVFGYQLFSHWQTSTDRLLRELHYANASLETLANTDGLSGLLNRRITEEGMRKEWHRAQRQEDQAALVMLDIDHFKDINDHYGHQAGDAVIRNLASTIKAVTRTIDLAGRYGGEEFVVVLPHANPEGALAFAERLRELVDMHPVVYEDRKIHVTISLGVAMLNADDLQPEQWLERADAALYQAKRFGRNQTIMADTPPIRGGAVYA